MLSQKQHPSYSEMSHPQSPNTSSNIPADRRRAKLENSPATSLLPSKINASADSIDDIQIEPTNIHTQTYKMYMKKRRRRSP